MVRSQRIARSTACPNGTAPPSIATTFTPVIIFPIVCPEAAMNMVR